MITANAILADCECFYYAYKKIEKETRMPIFNGDTDTYKLQMEEYFENLIRYNDIGVASQFQSKGGNLIWMLKAYHTLSGNASITSSSFRSIGRSNFLVG